MKLCSYIHERCIYRYIVATVTPKSKKCYSKFFNFDDFRAIAISPILLKERLEHCIYKCYEKFFVRSDNPLGSKKGIGCCCAT